MLGELVTQTDARQVRTTIVQRDALGRVLQQQREPLIPVVPTPCVRIVVAPINSPSWGEGK
ncbi:hypothetical protein [Tahibacter sp.]|uniref:hypothetical protein n=1 Tax=Tahibacter sp. TaxID=2056211 RepID=UPI0028C4029E|nr:hypothetical protein [Tahibacter sp.]